MILKWHDFDGGWSYLDNLTEVRLIGVWAYDDPNLPHWTGEVRSWGAVELDADNHQRLTSDVAPELADLTAVLSVRRGDMDDLRTRFRAYVNCKAMWLMNDDGKTVDTLVAYTSREHAADHGVTNNSYVRG